MSRPVAPASFLGWQPYPDGTFVDLWNLTRKVGERGIGFTVSGRTLEELGYALPKHPASPGPRKTWKNPANYRHQRLHSAKRYDPRSLRTVKAGRHRVRVGCPKGRYDARRKRCKTKTSAQALLHPNPPRKRGGGNPVVIYPSGVLRGTWYGRHRNGNLYRHRFGFNSVKSVYGMPDGSILIRSTSGSRLWRYH